MTHDLSDELRVIASDKVMPSSGDFDLMVCAADELDDLHRRLLATQEALIESQGKRIAQYDRLHELKRKQEQPVPMPVFWRVVYGAQR